MRPLIVVVSTALLAVGLFGSPFVHTHVHSAGGHDGHPAAGPAVHAHLPRALAHAASSPQMSVGSHDGESLDLFLFTTEKAPAPVTLAGVRFAGDTPVWPFSRKLNAENPTRARDPASTTTSPRAPPA